MKLKPFGDNVLIKPISTTEVKTSMGILVSTTLNGLSLGEVMSFGDDIVESLKVGCCAYYNKEAVRELPFDGVTYHIIPEHAIIATQHD